MTAIALAILLSAVPVSPAPGAAQAASSWPSHVDVFRRHAKGSSIPARVERVKTPVYIGRVLASGAMPADRPMEALKAMAVVVGTRVTWLSRHPDRRMRFKSRAFDVTDGSKPQWCRSCDHGMLYRRVHVHSRIRKAVAAVEGVVLRRPNGNLRKPQWSGPGYTVTGNRLPAMGASLLARRGWGYRKVLRHYFPKGTVR